MTARTWLADSTQPLAQAHDVALLDLDGVCYAGQLPIPHAAAALAASHKAGLRHQFVTNNASRTPEQVAAHLRELGIAAQADQVLTAAQDVAAIMAEQLPAGAAVLVVGSPALSEAVQAEGLRPVSSVDDAPVAVVQGLDKTLDWQRLTEGALAISRGAAYYASNLDSTLPTERGMALGNGALVAALQHATGVAPTPAGKPLAGIFARAVARSGARNPLGVGDRLGTDIRGAAAAAVPSLHVLTGVNDARDVALADPAERPAYLAVDLRGLHEVHPEVEALPDGARCRQAEAVVVEGHVRIDRHPLQEGAQLTGDQYRAVVCAVWAARDAHRAVTVPHFTVQAAC
ncbi:HAD hydrolase-like protein [Buchananella hordeovulneris]|uniref:HAD hydrolase-like protein n=1 Tax=Buchananella hordeovulneris TaxID=52770 RepID=UPI000F5FFA50|nr:HAD hydrolase-like protein [Buchananella hordeovulneris]RRD45553.1 hypothetical protein EII13_01455 [Buchananella hordeovulneris]